MAKSIITSNTSQVSARFKRMARNLPGVVDKSIHDLVEDEAIPLFEKTTATWNDKPDFLIVKTARGYGVRVEPQYPWDYVNKGTRVRRALMSRDWRSKTKPNVISSYGGAGRVVFISRKLSLPGIEARNFSDIILKRVQARAANRVRKDLSDASYGAGTGI